MVVMMFSQDNFWGWNRQGGSVLDMQTWNSDYDMAYNREFQRMCYMSEGQTKSSSMDTDLETLKALGDDTGVVGSYQHVHKKSPHFKYL